MSPFLLVGSGPLKSGGALPILSLARPVGIQDCRRSQVPACLMSPLESGHLTANSTSTMGRHTKPSPNYFALKGE